MKKTVLLVLLTTILGVGLVVLYRYNSTNSELTGDMNSQVASILKSNDCMACHTHNAELPFYAVGPVREVVEADMKKGVKFLDLSEAMDALERGMPVSESDLLKIRHSLIEGTMPLMKYKAVHWSTNLNGEEKQVLSNWVRETRNHFYPNVLAAKKHQDEPIKPLRDGLDVDPQKVKLGFDLYHDTRLSANNTVSCATCHDLTTGGVDRLKTSKGIYDQIGGINAPTVYNAALNHVQFWDGRAKDLQAQAGGPPLDKLEMGSTWPMIIEKLNADRNMRARFEAIYSEEGVTENSITDAIAEFEKTLLTPNARFDKYLKGDDNAITVAELEGYHLFKSNNCASCHGGENVGGTAFDHMGIAGDYFADRGTELHAKDMGLVGVTSDPNDKHRFKTPSLRNIELTYPYFHDGTINDLTEAVQLMSKYQNGVEMDVATAEKITDFLKTLTGENSHMK